MALVYALCIADIDYQLLCHLGLVERTVIYDKVKFCAILPVLLFEPSSLVIVLAAPPPTSVTMVRGFVTEAEEKYAE